MILLRYLSLALFIIRPALSSSASSPSLSPDQQAWLSKAKRFERAGWIYLHIEGAPRPRGFQHGYLLAKEIAEGLKLTRLGWEHQSAMDWQWLIDRSTALL